MPLRDRFRDLAMDTQRQVERLFDRWQDGGLSEREFVAAAAAVIARANHRTVRTADRAMAIQISRTLGRPVDAEPTDIGDDRPKLRDAVTTLLAERPEIAVTAAVLAESQRRRLGRLSRAEPLRRGQQAVQGHLKRHELGWQRAVGGDPCPLCDEWDDGVTRPADVDMARHPNCSCVQRAARL